MSKELLSKAFHRKKYVRNSDHTARDWNILIENDYMAYFMDVASVRYSLNHTKLHVDEVPIDHFHYLEADCPNCGELIVDTDSCCSKDYSFYNDHKNGGTILWCPSCNEYIWLVKGEVEETCYPSFTEEHLPF